MYFESAIDNKLNHINQQLDLLSYDYIDYMAESELYCEGAEDGFFDGVIKKLGEMIDIVKKKINEIISSSNTKRTVKKCEDIINQDPSKGKTKVNMVDYEQLDKLNKQTVQKLRSSNDPDTVMEGYRKQRNKILKAGAVVAVSLGTALFIVKKQTGKKIEDLESQLKKTEDTLHKYKSGYKKVKEQNKAIGDENKKLNRSLQIANAPTIKDKTKVATKLIGEDLEEKGTNFAKNVSVIKKRAKAESEIIANASKDVVNSLSEAVKVCANPTANPIKKVGSVAKGMSNVIGTGKNIVTGKAKAESHEKSKADIKNDILKLQRKLSKAKAIYKDTGKSNEDRARASKFIKGATYQLDVLKRTYNSL